MRRNSAPLTFIFTAASLLLFCGNASAQCPTLPNQLTNGTTADASQVMANFNAIVTCLESLEPAGPTNAVQYNSGSGLAGVGPLTNGQLIIGSTGAPPQAATLTPGPGISITNGVGSVTISSSGGAGGSLIQQVSSVLARGNPITSLTTNNSVTSGDILIVGTDWYQGASAAPTISDTLGTSFALEVSNSNTGQSSVAIFVGVAPSSGPDTVTIGYPSGSSWQGIAISEFRNVSTAVDNAAVVYNGRLSVTTVLNGDLIYTYAGSPNSGNFFYPPPPGFLIGQYSGSQDASGWSFAVQNSAGFLDCTPANVSSGSSLAAIALEPLSSAQASVRR